MSSQYSVLISLRDAIVMYRFLKSRIEKLDPEKLELLRYLEQEIERNGAAA